MKMNHELGFEPVTYSELTTDNHFWENCKPCVNCSILMSKERKNCLCTAMLYDPKGKNLKQIFLKISRKNLVLMDMRFFCGSLLDN